MVTALSYKAEQLSDSSTDIRTVHVLVRRRRYSFGWGDLKILDSGIFDKADDKEEGNPFCRNLQNYENKENITKK